jgi:transposase InsO family protein
VILPIRGLNCGWKPKWIVSMEFDDKENVVVSRMKIVTPFLDKQLTKQDVIRLRKLIAEEEGISERSVARYVKRFQDLGIDGLKPSNNGRPGDRVIAPEIFNIVLLMRKEQPKRSVGDIIRCLEYQGYIQKGEIKRSTLQDKLERAGFSKKQMKIYSSEYGGKRFQRKNRNELWQSDTKHGVYIGKRKTYLISFIDDCTRKILHSEFYFVETTENVMDCFRKAITKYGTPREIYLDNGSPYKSNALERACAFLQIKKRHHKPYAPKSKGKVEKFHQVVDKFIDEVRISKTDSLESLNHRWASYCYAFYQTVPHSALHNNKTPDMAFDEDEAELRFVIAEELDNAFLMVVRGRTVDKSGCVNFNSKKYTAPELDGFIGKKVDIVWDPTCHSKMWIQYKELPKVPIVLMDIKEWVPNKPKTPPPLPGVEVGGSRILDAAQSVYEAKIQSEYAELFGNKLKCNLEEDSNFTSCKPRVTIPEVEKQARQERKRVISFQDMKSLDDNELTTSESECSDNKQKAFSFTKMNKGDVND